LTCGVFDAAPFRARMFEKHMWICAFMLLGVTHSGTVGDVESKHKDELVKMVTEMMSAISDETGVKFESGCPEVCFNLFSPSQEPQIVSECLLGF
jgi:hypothetical protein